ncbi:MAG TPA: hypothetical protein VGN57_08375 [Pirellulaceae bacterium]|jgi:hypothetical protein|nr:hypothetical protein [Pirellulaceae bacterium]
MAITYGGMTLLSVRSAEARRVGSAARRLARRIGLDVQGVNELVWPAGADRFGGMIGLIEEARVATLRELWQPWRDETTPEPSELPQLHFHEAPPLPASLAALEPIDGAAGGLFLVALTDARRALQEARFAAVTDPTLVGWSTAIDAVVGSDGPERILSHSIAGRLAPEIDDPHVLAMTRGEWLEAAAWSVGGGWRLRSSGELELQSPSQADEVEAGNRSAAPGLAEGRYDQEPIRPVASVRLRVRESRGAVPWPRGEATFDAVASAIEAGVRWSPRSTALWERAPVDASQENAGEFQALADALLADAQAWTGRTYEVHLAGFAPWHPSARDRTVRWIDRGRVCRTIVQTKTTEDLPTTLIHRSSVTPREASLAEAITETSVSPGGSVTATLLAATGRPARQVTAGYPSHPPGLSLAAGQFVWLDYDRSAGQWVLVPWTTT